MGNFNWGPGWCNNIVSIFSLLLIQVEQLGKKKRFVSHYPTDQLKMLRNSMDCLTDWLDMTLIVLTWPLNLKINNFLVMCTEWHGTCTLFTLSRHQLQPIIINFHSSCWLLLSGIKFPIISLPSQTFGSFRSGVRTQVSYCMILVTTLFFFNCF